jgi:flavin-dependent dehydrogenase
MNESSTDRDVVVLGGGLAGLALAIQLRRRFAGLSVLVVERRRHPVPVAAHKVGESTVEIGARYFEHTLGLREHLDGAQLRKFGFRFFFSDRRRDLDGVTELGASRPLPVPSWQIDRGVFENFLGERARSLGIDFVDGATVRGVDLGSGGAAHLVRWHDADGAPRSTSVRWVVDASGRAGLLKRKLGLAVESPHAAHAVWFRVRGRIEIDRWSDDPEWRSRVESPTRWRATNHLCGAGYWVWLIPLASGAHSVGIVADPRRHPLSSMDTFDKAMDWLAIHQPRLHEDLERRRDGVLDFAFLRRFSHDCAQLLSPDRWVIVGEAGRFLDPFYSPGSDFIAIGNTLVAELVARDRAGLKLAAHAQVFEQMLRSFHDCTLALYVDQSGLFGDAEVMPVKVLWDYTYYWGVPAQLCFHDRLADLATLASLRDVLAGCRRLNDEVQRFLRAWSEAGPHGNPRRVIDQASMPWFVALNASLLETVDDAGFRARIRASARRMEALAAQIAERACADHPQLDATALRALLPADAGAGFESMLDFETESATG